MSRRINAGVLARLVTQHRLDEDEAAETAIDLVTTRPATVFKL
jgi:glucuronate isomerase